MVCDCFLNRSAVEAVIADGVGMPYPSIIFGCVDYRAVTETVLPKLFANIPSKWAAPLFEMKPGFPAAR